MRLPAGKFEVAIPAIGNLPDPELKGWSNSKVTSWSFENRPMSVIPAQAGIHSANILKCAAYGLDSRLRGNDWYFGSDPIPNDTGNANLNRSPAYAAQW